VKEACRSVVEALRERILTDKRKGGELRLPTPEAAAAQAASPFYRASPPAMVFLFRLFIHD